MNAFVHVVRAELFKLLRKRRSYVLAGLWWGLLPALGLLVGHVLFTTLGGSFANEGGGIDLAIDAIASPYGLARIALVGPAYLAPSFYLIVVALLATLLVGEERGHSMWKTVLVAQPQRLAVMAGKVAVAMLALAALMAGAALAGVLFGALGTLWLPTGWGGAWGALLGLYALQWLLSAALVLFTFLLVFLFKNMVLGVVTAFFLPGLLEGIYTLYRATVGFAPVNRLNVFFQAIELQQRLEAIPRYFFTSNAYAPARAPLRELVAAIGAGGADIPPDALSQLLGADLTLQHSALVMLGYALVFGVLLFWRFARHDVE